MMTHPRILSLAVLALSSSVSSAATFGYYQFEDDPGFTQDSSGAGRDLTTPTLAPPTQIDTPFADTGGLKAAEYEISGGVTGVFRAADPAPYSDLTIEAFVNLESVDSGSVARVIASQWGSDGSKTFNFGVAGNGSGAFTEDRSLFLQLTSNGSTLININSGFQLALGKNYYVAAVVDTDAAGGTVNFYVQNLSDGGAVLTSSPTVSGLTGLHNSPASIGIGSSASNSDVVSSYWDGVLDNVRLSDSALSAGELLIPEPSTAALLGVTGFSFGLRRRRQA